MRLRIEKAVYGGSGLARVTDGPDVQDQAAGKTVFVPMTLPGELVEAHIVEDRGSFANAELDAIVEPAPERTLPGCPYYGLCGGCHYQHAAYPQQLEMKSAILRETLERARIPGTLPAIEILSAEPWGYRNRVRLHISHAMGEAAALCYRQRKSHTPLRVDECPIAAPVLARALQAVQRLFGGMTAPNPHWEEIEFFTNSKQDAVLVSISTSELEDGQTQLDDFCTTLDADLPELRGAAIFSTGDEPRRPLTQWGHQALAYTTARHEYHVSLGSFFQTNRLLIDPLIDLVTRGHSGELAWDLYAGVGLFARALTASFGTVRAVESAPSSCADLRRNLEGTSHKIVESSTVDFLRLQANFKAGAKTPKRSVASKKPDLIVVDPPRVGLGAEVTTLLAAVAPRDIVYVSCDPATLARDLRALVQSGYRIQNITMVDMFPQTFHLESVSRLSLR